MIKAAAFAKQMKKRGAKPPPYLMASGDEEFFRAESRTAVLDALGEGVDLVEMQWRDGDNDEQLRDLFDELDTASLFAPAKVVVLTDAKGFLTAAKDNFMRLLESEPPAAHLVLDGEALVPKKSKKPSALVRAFEAAGGVIVDCHALYNSPFGYGKPPWDSDLGRWVVDRARDNGKSMSLQVAYDLHNRDCAGLRGIVGEIEKLVMHVEGREEITADDVRAVVGGVEEATVFEVVDAFAERDLKGTLSAFKRLCLVGVANNSGAKSLDTRSISIQICALLQNRLHELGRLIEKTRAGESFESAAGAVLGAHRKWVFPRYRAQMQARNPRELGDAVIELTTIDAGMKQGAGEPRDLLSKYFVEHAGAPPVRSDNPFAGRAR